ncbi:MAG: PEP/pyruvate-binding domain-containing protein [Patescibacteria group bacterium]|nr:PEP/pyruvate-binding domain-containing protein [Patescibacteria group bacterium]
MSRPIYILDSIPQTAGLGGKALGLSLLHKSGLNVPPGFVIAPDTNIGNFSRIILKEFDQLNCSSVAVRSSANIEDSKDYSFAGLFCSFLGVRRYELLEKIMECRESISERKVIAYCKSTGTCLQDITMSVIIQRMVNSRISGVAFSSNPLDYKKTEVLIEAVRGQGIVLVSGEMTPDTYFVDKDCFKINQTKVAAQHNELTISPTGKLTESRIGNRIANNQKLNANEIQELVKAIIQIEKSFKHPVDIEWAFEADKLYILQSRPITTNDK